MEGVLISICMMSENLGRAAKMIRIDVDQSIERTKDKKCYLKFQIQTDDK